MDLPTRDELLDRMRSFCERHQMAPSRFGRECNGEGQLIKSIEEGRSPSLDLLHQIRNFMAAKDAELEIEERASAARDAA